jgi:predicted enzyme related to lactoylglutathione lyase
MESPVLLFEVAAIDLKKLSKFYFEVFGWQGSEGAGAGFIPFAPAPRPMWGVIIKAQLGKSGWEKGITFYIQVENLDAALEKIQAQGGFVAVEPVEVPAYGFRFAMFKDPEFNLIGIVELMAQGQTE